METFEIAVPTTHDSDALIAQIERATAAEGLHSGERLTLRAFPGSIHWHLRRPNTKGVLELTHWPSQGRLWFAVHANRQAGWIAPAIERLQERLQQVVD
jgi:hypothetical protein